MNTTDYLCEGYRQLSDPPFYTELDHDPTNSISERICKTLTEMKDCKLITEKNFDFLNIREPQAGRLYLLPKIHKKPVPGKPIYSFIGHPTCNISKFVDAYIKDYEPETASYVRDTQHFISRLRTIGTVPEGALLVTLDVSTLYMKIPNGEGILAVAAFLRRDRTKDPITPYLLRLLELVPHSMNFTFNEHKWAQQWHQIMPTYSWIGSKLKALHGWPHGRKELDNFIKYLNGIHEKIKFTSEVSSSSINFLDTTIKVDTDNNLYTTLYEKPTDTHLYFHYDSAHHGPRHTKGPHAQFLRLRRICTRNEDFIENGINMLKYYLNRGFPFKQLKNICLELAKLHKMNY